MVRYIHNIRRRVWRLRNLALVLVAFASTACGNVSPTKKAFDAITQQQAEDVRDGCVADTLALLQALADRIAPLARADGDEGLEATAAALDCTIETTSDGYRLFCPAMEVRDSTLAVEMFLSFVADEVSLQVAGSDGVLTVEGTLTLRDDPARGLVLRGDLESNDAGGCRTIAQFDEIVGLEAFDLPGDSPSLFFRQGAVDLLVLRENATELARGSAALAGRAAFVVLNFDGFSLFGDLAFD